MGNDKGSFVVYLDIKEIVDELDDAQVAALFRAMLDYQTTGKVPKLSGALRYIFIPIRQQMDRDREKWDKTKAARSESGRKGGLKSGEARAKQKEANEANASFGSSNEANEANEAVNVNVNVNVNDNVNGTVSDSLPDASSLSLSLIEYLNDKVGTEYKADKATTERISILLEDGYTEEQIRTVIDRKCSEWLNDEKMRTYLRPSTLFGDKFPEYVAAPISVAFERERNEADKRESLTEELDQKKQTLDTLRASLEEIPKGTRLGERRLLKEQIAQLEDSIGLIERRLA